MRDSRFSPGTFWAVQQAHAESVQSIMTQHSGGLATYYTRLPVFDPLKLSEDRKILVKRS